jgi:hypothetical protein
MPVRLMRAEKSPSMKNKSIAPRPPSHKAMAGQREHRDHGEDIKIIVIF